MTLFLFIIFIYYLKKKGIDFFILAAISCILFFYPIIFFDDLIFVSDAVYSVPVNLGAKISIIIGIIFLLIIGLFIRPIEAAPLNYDVQIKFYSYVVAGLVILFMLMIIYDNGIGLQGREKTEVMENLGYIYKIYSVLGLILITFAFLVKIRWLIILAFIVAFFDLIFGFRGGFAELIMIAFLTTTARPGWHNVRLIIYGIVGLMFMILIKESAYFTKNLSVVFDLLFNVYEANGLQILSMANGESASISAVYNQIIASNFSVSLEYLVDCFISFFPLMDKLDFHAVGFADYFKGILFGNEGDSFASGGLAVSYAIASYIGVALSFIMLAFYGYLYERIKSTKRVLLRLAFTSIGAILLISFFRSDFIFLIGLIRSIIMICLFLYIILIIFILPNLKKLKVVKQQ
jgi:hypothetical protein